MLTRGTIKPMLERDWVAKLARERASLVASFERMPVSVFDDIEPNAEMAERVWDTRLKAWFDPDFLVKHAAVFALGRSTGSQKLVQTPTSHRGVLLSLQAPFFDEFGNCYGEIGVKGTGLTTRGVEHFTHGFQGFSQDGKRLQLQTMYDPLGFFGYVHAKEAEQKVSDLFAGYGGRNGRVLAIMTLNRRRFLEWYHQLPGAPSAYPVEEIFARVEEVNKDRAVLCVRLMGTERCQDYLHTQKQGLYTREQMLKRVARLLWWEIRFGGDERFFQKYGLADARKYPPHLARIVQGRASTNDYHQLLFLQDYLYLWNLDVTQRLSWDHFQGGLCMAVSEQNVDGVAFFYDWETAVPGIPGYSGYHTTRTNPIGLFSSLEYISLDERRAISTSALWYLEARLGRRIPVSAL